MTPEQRDSLNKELCGLLGINPKILSVMGGMMWEYPDFTSEAGRVQLLKLMFERKGFDKFIDLMVNPYNFILYLRDDNGAFAIATRDFLKAMEERNET